VTLLTETAINSHFYYLFLFIHIDFTCFSGAIPEGKHVMLSYHRNSQDIVSKIYQILQEEHIPVWFNGKKDITDDVYNRYSLENDFSFFKSYNCTVFSFSLADGVDNAAIVCCFVMEDYEKSDSCKLELQYAYKRHKQIIPCLLNDAKDWKPCRWLEPIITGVICVDFHNASKTNIYTKARELIDRIKEQPIRHHNIYHQIHLIDQVIYSNWLDININEIVV
jgi:hypothetical protein